MGMMKSSPRLKRADEASGSDIPQPTPIAGTATIVGEREEIGRIAYYVGRGYELQVGPTPYYMVAEDRWEEFIDFSAQRQEFSILIRHEYPDLALWLRQENLLPEFIRLVESTYRDVPPSRVENRQQTTPSPDDGGTTEVQINRLAKFGLWVSLVSLPRCDCPTAVVRKFDPRSTCCCCWLRCKISD